MRPHFRKERKMQKTIKIGNEQSIILDNNSSWFLIYRNQFNNDILPTVMPVISTVLKMITDVIAEAKTDDGIDITKIDGDVIDNALIELSALEFTDAIHIIWSLAKTANDDIPEPIEWLKRFDNFPIDVIIPVAFELIAKGCISVKNFKRLQDLKKTMSELKPQVSKVLSQQELKED